LYCCIRNINAFYFLQDILLANEGDNPVMQKFFNIYLSFLQVGQSETLLRHVFAGLRAFLNNYSIALFQGNYSFIIFKKLDFIKEFYTQKSKYIKLVFSIKLRIQRIRVKTCTKLEPNLYFIGNAMLCGRLCYELLRCCNSKLSSIRQESCALLYLLMRSNFEFTSRKGLTRVHLQVIFTFKISIKNIFNKSKKKPNIHEMSKYDYIHAQ
jgi:hypothetical protein